MNPEEFAQQVIEEDGTYRVFPISWTLEKYDSGSVALAIRLSIRQKWHGKEQGWSEPYPPGWYTDHRAWILVRARGRDGKPIEGAEPVLSEKTLKRLHECGIWDGDFDKIDGPPPQVFVHADIAGEEYEGRVRYRADWINPDLPEPKARGSFAPVDRGLLDNLRAKHGAKARAMNAPPPGSGVTPPAPPSAPLPAASGDAEGAAPPRPAAPAPPSPSSGVPAPPAPAAPTPSSTPKPPVWGGSSTGGDSPEAIDSEDIPF